MAHNNHHHDNGNHYGHHKHGGGPPNHAMNDGQQMVLCVCCGFICYNLINCMCNTVECEYDICPKNMRGICKIPFCGLYWKNNKHLCWKGPKVHIKRRGSHSRSHSR